MRTHVAILKRYYLELILQGLKSIECRLSQVRRPPFGCVAAGDKILLKLSSGPVVAETVVKKVRFFDKLTSEDMEKINHRYNDKIMASNDYWRQHRQARYCSLIWLGKIKEITPYRIINRSRSGWLGLEQADKNSSLYCCSI
jgi:ASC-1-like (ASCH) protein